MIRKDLTKPMHKGDAFDNQYSYFMNRFFGLLAPKIGFCYVLNCNP